MLFPCQCKTHPECRTFSANYHVKELIRVWRSVNNGMIISGQISLTNNIIRVIAPGLVSFFNLFLGDFKGHVCLPFHSPGAALWVCAQPGTWLPALWQPGRVPPGRCGRGPCGGPGQGPSRGSRKRAFSSCERKSLWGWPGEGSQVPRIHEIPETG